MVKQHLFFFSLEFFYSKMLSHVVMMIRVKNSTLNFVRLLNRGRKWEKNYLRCCPGSRKDSVKLSSSQNGAWLEHWDNPHSWGQEQELSSCGWVNSAEGAVWYCLLLRGFYVSSFIFFLSPLSLASLVLQFIFLSHCCFK